MLRLSFSAIVLATPAFADPDGYGHMMNWGYGLGMVLGPVLWLLVLGLIVAGVVWLVRGPAGAERRNDRQSALAELDLRFARGEIDAEDYTARKKLLSD